MSTPAPAPTPIDLGQRWRRARRHAREAAQRWPEPPRPPIPGLSPPRDDSAAVLLDDDTDLDPPPPVDPDAPWPLLDDAGRVDWPATVTGLRVAIGRDPAAPVGRAA